jgi:hypothetical protein
LRPVGPRPSRVYWVRRAVLLAIVLILIVVVAEACSGGGAGGKGGNAGGSPTVRHTSKPPLAACTPSALTLTMSTDTKTYTSGQAPKLIGTFTNPSSTACKLARSASEETWTIKSGTPTVWTSKGCDSSTSNVAKQLKVGAGATKVVSIFWNGHLRASDCKDSGVAKAGTYRLYATLDGVTGKPAIFHITT